jgi:hypothetical protein
MQENFLALRVREFWLKEFHIHGKVCLEYAPLAVKE